MADENPVKRKEREPITYVFSLILLAACILAIGIFVNDHILNDDNVYTTSSDSVTVNYTGALYNYYDNGGYMFQTTVSSIDGNQDYKRISEYSYSSSTMTISLADGTVSSGSSKVLKGFYTACIGHKVGDVVKVCIPAAEAYNFTETHNVLSCTSITTRNNFWSTTSTVTAADNLDWTYTATYDSGKNMYLISYTMASSDIIESTKITTATVKTTGFTYGTDTVTYSVTVSDVKATADCEYEGVTYKGFESITLLSGDSAVEIIGATDVSAEHVASGSLLTKETKEIYNKDLYFTIEIVSIS